MGYSKQIDEGYSMRIVRGFSWSAVLNFTAMAISFGKIILLTHFVFGPVEFGVFGVGVLVLGFLELVTEVGINVFLVQETGPLEEFLDTAWVISIFRGVIISLAVILLSYPLAVFFKITSSWPFILSFSLLPLIRGFLNPAIANLQKKLRFKQDAIYRFSISAIEDFSIVLLAFLTHNIFSFVLGMIIGSIFEVILTFVIIHEKPKFKFNRIHLGQIVNRGKWVTLAQLFDYLFEHIDDIAVARLLNAFSLGIYQPSYTIASLPENAIAQQLSKVTFPVYVKMTEDKERIKRGFVRTFWTTLLIIAPFGILMFFFSDPIVRIILGNKWLPAIPVLRVLSLFGIVRALTNLFYPVFLAFKKQNYVTITLLASIVVLLILIVPMTMRFGITGAALAALIGSLASLPVAYVLCRKLF